MGLYDKLRVMKIALVEDDPWIRDSLCLYLQNEGCHPRPFDNAAEGMKALKNERFDLIISDSWLPDMDGQTFLSRAKDLSPRSIRILIAADPRIEDTDGDGPSDVHVRIQKPLTIRKLEESLEPLLAEAAGCK